MDDLQRKSERVVEGRTNELLMRKHVATYEWAAEKCADLEVLDYGCGTGYGAAMVAGKAGSVVGVDVDWTTIEYAKGRYQRDNLRYQLISQDRLPFDDASFDVLLSFQVIEHVDPDPYLREARRVLRKGGRLLVSTPNRRVRLFRFQKPWNPWHLTEYDRDGLSRLLIRHFDHVEMLDLVGDQEGELRRYRRNRMLALPFTLPVTPEAVRRRVLR